MACLWPASYGVNTGFRVFVASLLWGFGWVAEITIGWWAKVIIRGGYPGGYPRGFIAEMEFTPIMGWPKRAYYWESGVKNDVFDASPLGGLGTEFPCF